MAQNISCPMRDMIATGWYTPKPKIKSELDYSIDLMTRQFKALTLNESHPRGVKRTLPQGISSKGSKRARYDFEARGLTPLKRNHADIDTPPLRPSKRIRHLVA